MMYRVEKISQFRRDLISFTKDYWFEVASLVVGMAIVIEVLLRIFQWLG